MGNETPRLTLHFKSYFISISNQRNNETLEDLPDGT